MLTVAARTTFVRSRRGAALMVAVVSIAIIVILAVAAAPALAGYNDLQRASETQAILLSLESSLVNTNLALGRRGLQPVLGINRFPGRLSHLTIPITTAQFRCNTSNYVNPDVTA